MNRTVMVFTGQRFTSSVIAINTLNEHSKVRMLISDIKANDPGDYDAIPVRLPRRIFRGRLRAYNNTWKLTHGASLAHVI